MLLAVLYFYFFFLVHFLYAHIVCDSHANSHKKLNGAPDVYIQRDCIFMAYSLPTNTFVAIFYGLWCTGVVTAVGIVMHFHYTILNGDDLSLIHSNKIDVIRNILLCFSHIKSSPASLVFLNVELLWQIQIEFVWSKWNSHGVILLNVIAQYILCLFWFYFYITSDIFLSMQNPSWRYVPARHPAVNSHWQMRDFLWSQPNQPAENTIQITSFTYNYDAVEQFEQQFLLNRADSFIHSFRYNLFVL